MEAACIGSGIMPHVHGSDHCPVYADFEPDGMWHSLKKKNAASENFFFAHIDACIRKFLQILP